MLALPGAPGNAAIPGGHSRARHDTRRWSDVPTPARLHGHERDDPLKRTFSTPVVPYVIGVHQDAPMWSGKPPMC
ncbi:MAG: hypothetical protein M1546_23470 [Chloroflexi bacterium]|nr:hypothetical protein [Chloroflexota bacterium]